MNNSTETKTMKVFVTEYALTKGILTKEVIISNDKKIAREKDNTLNLYAKPFWHDKLEDAINHAEELRDKKIKSYEGRIQKLNKLDFRK